MKIVKLGEQSEELRTLILPSGIGEFQWLWTKMVNTGEDFAIFGLDGAPRRLHQFAELHPQVKEFGWATFDYSQIREWQKFHDLTTWENLTKKFQRGQMTMLACNPHLEAGNPLASWLPDLPTSYTYPIVTMESHHREADYVLHDRTDFRPRIGISCASYRGAAAWKTWERDEWTSFLKMIQKAYPEVVFVLMGGSWDDLTYALFRENGLRWQVDDRGLPPVGTTTFGGAIEVLRRLDGYIGFSSGLGHVAAHLCNLPVFMLWPEHEQLLSRTWCNPALLEDGRYVPSRWLSPEEVWKSAEPWLRRALEDF